VVGPPAESAAAVDSTGTGEESTAGNARIPIVEQDASHSASQIIARLALAKERRASERVDLDLAQRRFVLDQHQFDSNPNHATDTAGQTALQNEAQQVEEAKQRVADAEREVASLEQELPAAAAPVSAH
jgi:hypothetical protein